MWNSVHSCDQECMYNILDTRIGVILNLPFKKTGHGSWCYIYDQKGMESQSTECLDILIVLCS